MAQAPELELKDLLLSNSSFGPNEISFIRRRVCNDYSQLGELKDVTAELESQTCLLYTSPSPRDRTRSRMPSSA